MYVANCSLKYNPEDFTVVDRVLTLAGNTELVGDPFIAHHCGGLLLDGGVFAEKKVDGKYVVTLVGETPTAYMKAKCSLLCDSAKFEIVEGALSLKAVEPSGFDIRWDGNTEGLESVDDFYYKVSELSESSITQEQLVGSTMELLVDDEQVSHKVISSDITTDDNKVFAISYSGDGVIIIAFDDGSWESADYSSGIWFAGNYGVVVSRFYKEVTTEEGFDITWDGDTEGLDVVDDEIYKVSDIIEGLSNASDLIGAKIIAYNQGSTVEATISEESILTEDNKVFALYMGEGSPIVYVAFENGTYDDGYLVFSKGIWFINLYGTIYASRLYKE